MDDGSSTERNGLRRGDERGGGGDVRALDDRDVAELPIRARFVIVRRVIAGLREALDASTGRLDVIARQYDAERETARRMIVDLGRWCELAEEHVIAIAREQDATDSKGGEK